MALLFVFVLLLCVRTAPAEATLGINWGLRSSHPLPPSIVVGLLRDNGFSKVKLFEADPLAMAALAGTGIEVMLGIPNELLSPLAASVSFAEAYVVQNVSAFVSSGVDVAYLAVGNEPFLKTYGGAHLGTTFPAMQNVQAALVKARLGSRVKVTVPLNADVYQSPTGVPSSGDFRPDIHGAVLDIVRFLHQSAYPLVVNIYPFLSLQADPNFPREYAFFDGAPPAGAAVVDGGVTYTNVFDANYDTLVWALERNGYGDLEIIVGEIGWPTDGDRDATSDNARRFMQGLVEAVVQRRGTPKRPRAPPDFYLFSLLDEDAKSVAPGNFERHWGLFNFDGTAKYNLLIGNAHLVPAKGVRYLRREWCVFGGAAIGERTAAAEYACMHADCTSIGYGGSCYGRLDAPANVSYAFNQYYQTMDQRGGACGFDNLSVVTSVDPSVGGCRFPIMIDVRSGHQPSPAFRLFASGTLITTLLTATIFLSSNSYIK